MHLQDWLDDVLRGHSDEPGDDGAPPPDTGEVGEARHLLDEAAASVRTALAGTVPEALPLSVTKGRAAAMTTCEGLAVARWGPAAGDDWAMLKGRALDAYVAHHLFAGPVADPVSDLAAMWEARGDLLDAETVRALAPGDDRVADLVELAAAAGRLRIDPSWVPRVEVRVGTTFGDGALRLSGRLDVLLGGPGTDRPAVAIEVKSGRSHGSHLAEAYHYALLCALRHGTPPAGIGVWYPDGTLVPLVVPGAVLASARRAADTASALAELWSGRPPDLRPGPHCGWCPRALECPAATQPEGWGLVDADGVILRDGDDAGDGEPW